jgi:monoamine oxidase
MRAAEYDLAVVGGGVAGLYCAMHAPPGWKVALFEGSHRIGGKLETVAMQGFDAEYGAMRFDPVRQYRLGKLIEELGVETQPFPEYLSPPDQQFQSSYPVENAECGLSSLGLYKLAIQRVLGMSETDLMALSEENLESIRREGVVFGCPLWEQGLWNVLGKVISPHALRFILTDGSFFHFIHENPGAAAWMITWVKMLQMSPHLKTMRHGMNALTDAMLARIQQRGADLHRAHVLAALETYDRERVRLHFSEKQSCIARHAVLALPEHSLSRIAGIPMSIRALLGSVLNIPLLKCFFVVRDPWWEENIPHLDIAQLPAREMHYQKSDGKGLIMVYADRPYMNFWTQYLRKGYETRAEIDGDKNLPRAFAHFLNIDPKRVLNYGIRHWGIEPYGAACHLWKPGMKSWKIEEKVTAFALERHCPSNVHICGEAFSDYQGFIEGALRTAQNVIARMAK